MSELFLFNGRYYVGRTAARLRRYERHRLRAIGRCRLCLWWNYRLRTLAIVKGHRPRAVRRKTNAELIDLVTRET